MSRTHRRAKARGGAAFTLPWLRAPILLIRRPVVFAAIVAATAILATATGSGPLFLSTIGTASLASQAGQSCPERTRPGMTKLVPPIGVGAVTRDGIAAMKRAQLPDSYSVAVGQAQVQSSLIHLYARSGALDHVTTLTPRGRPGAWVPDTFASKLGVRPGATITTSDSKQILVAGIYRDLAPDPFTLPNLSPYWCAWNDLLVSTAASDAAIAATPPDQRQGPVLLTDSSTVSRVASGPVRVSWWSPMSSQTSALGAFDVADDRADVAAASVGAEHDLHLAESSRIAHTAQSGISGSIVPIEVAGVLIAGLLVAGAGFFWSNARRREIRLLVARGVSPPALAGKAALETALPAAVGAGLGFAGTQYLVRAVGPASVFEPGAPLRAFGLVVGTLLLGLLVIAVIGGLAGRERTTGRRASWVSVVPWELLLVGTAVLIAATSLDTSAVTIDHTVVRISALVILYPLLGATGALLLLGRLIGLLLPAVGRSARRSPAAAFLALRRMSRSRVVAIGLIVGTALPCCLLMYGSTVRNTVRDEVTQKYQTNLGAPHVLQVYGVRKTILDLHDDATQVVVYDQDVTLGDNPNATVLGVDPTTFRRFAFLTSGQRDALDRLRSPAAGRTVPAIIVNGAGTKPTALLISHTRFRLEPVATSAVFPGLRNGTFPLVVVDRSALADVDDATERTNQIWTDNKHYGAARGLIAANKKYSILFELTSKIVVGTTGLLPVTWVFGYLQALAILIGVVALAGLVFGLAARTRTRRVSYVLSRRMGMSKLTHFNSLLIELGIVIGLGWTAGSSLGLGSFGFIYRRLDVYPDLPPGPAFSLPTVPLVATGVVVLAVVVLAASATQALAQRTRPAEILRLE
ncbi:MAG: FtsX-like permease family protein [Jatrophihabitans sp.]